MENSTSTAAAAATPNSVNILSKIQGQYAGYYSSHGFELINIQYTHDQELQKHSLVATKITGDPYVPAGKITWKLENKTNEECQTLPVRGFGQIANRGFVTPQFIPGALIYHSTDFTALIFEWFNCGPVIYFKRQIPNEVAETAAAESEQTESQAQPPSTISSTEALLYMNRLRDFVQTLSIESAYASPYQVGGVRSATKEKIESNSEAFVYSVQNQTEGEDKGTCVICMEDFEDGSQCRKLNVCNHQFHSKCIEEWLMRISECPLCKRKLE